MSPWEVIVAVRTWELAGAEAKYPVRRLSRASGWRDSAAAGVLGERGIGDGGARREVDA
jgi:hypothetical protein